MVCHRIRKTAEGMSKRMNVSDMRYGLNALISFSVLINFLWMWRYLSIKATVVEKSLRNNNITVAVAQAKLIANMTLTNSNLTTKSSSIITVNEETDLTEAKSIKTSTKMFLKTTPDTRSPCDQPSRLWGPLTIDLNETRQAYLELNKVYERQSKQPSVVFETSQCRPMLSVAIIIPFRDRELHLEYLLGHLHPILERQLLRYQIFVVEQVGNFTFNKGRLMNTGFEYARKNYTTKFDCYIFQDVDMFLENDHNIYKCHINSTKVLHLSCAVDKFEYKPLCCGMTVGGVLSFDESVYVKVNGFPNDYWGWGGEDDDMNVRLMKHGVKVVRPDSSLCRYFMIKHQMDKLNPNVPDKVHARVRQAKKKADTNGLNNLSTRVVKVVPHFLYVRVFVDVGLPDS